ncbi:hypothetical protein DL766_000368 [Monosporascus sp. MC13-8B]|uniref:ARS-binding protein 2 n=1 Tax=Monosporascus cannonballus TaxID=155416 RepID=A0ABY0HG59_9PEZI|nr:hypothetical protein DL762_001678 [Monosporascus cannonballus]RYO99972.1 hypothetical protein DL763_001103 [Monosporascus cannonballus]RYP39546.1 hypothetical protein DL766_000368 [Monosporascus sp. MC13-8B]
MATVMAIQSSINGVHHSIIPSPRTPELRPTLPSRFVTSATIEDAYVSFILYCNPAVPPDTDTTTLREAFRTPPKSGGKSFSTFTLFQLIKQLGDKEIKTWAELALKLGVEPPDQDKGESSQKIQQYAVRLKRWMHSMHVNAFFDYLLENPHPYWTQVPSSSDPICEDGRDGVAAEDDMALRALLPHIRPRRGRRKPEDEPLNKSPSQRPRLDSPPPASNGDGRQSRPEPMDSWASHPENRSSFVFPPIDQPRSSVVPGPDSMFPWSNDSTRTPMSAYPHSALTPATRGSFWGDSEPLSAITPSRAKQLTRRHGAKVVSSAWRSGGSFTGAKTRGRPPISRFNEPLSAFPEGNKSFHSITLDHKVPTPVTTSAPTSAPAFRADPLPQPREPEPVQPPTSRPPRPSGLSLQVPERVGGSVRLATPPPPPLVLTPPPGTNTNGEKASHSTVRRAPDAWNYTMLNPSSPLFTNPTAAGNSNWKMEIKFDDDMGNCEEIECLFASELLDADWFDENGQQVEVGSMEEVFALVRASIENISKEAKSKEAFLLNLSCLAGAGHMLRTSKSSVQRKYVGPDYTEYLCGWELQYGAIKGKFSSVDRVPHSRWKKGYMKTPTGDPDPFEIDAVPAEGDAAAKYWRRRYASLLQAVKSRNDHINGFKKHSLQFMKTPPGNG